VQYRGIQYQVLEKINPAGWQWTVSMDGRRQRLGEAHSRPVAVALAQRAIDKLIKVVPDQQTPPQHRSYDALRS
jgi:hypothetical protein